MATSTLPVSGAPNADTAFFGHPRGLSTLFFTELWERFSYYGMRALLILFMTADAANGGLGFETSKAGVIYGLYTSTAYLMCLPGGWLADRFLGQRKAVFYGGIIIAAGHFCLAVPSLSMFYFGLSLIVIGTGLLKPNVSAQVGMLYAQDDARRDAGFSIYYMGINIGAFLSPLICGYLGEQISWHYGFAAAGVGMALGVVQYGLGGKHLGEAGLRPAPPVDAADAARQRRLLRVGSVSLGALLLLVGGLAVSGAVTLTADIVSNAFSVLLFTVVTAVFVWLLRSAEWTSVERRRFVVVIVLFFAAALFWSAFEQAGSSLNLFAERSTNLSVPSWMQMLTGGPEMPASWFQSLNSLFLMALAPVFAALWIYLGHRNPNSTAKFAWGLVLVGLGFVVMVGGATIAATGVKVSPLWLTGVYLIHTIGELCLSPVGLSAMTKLAPIRLTGLIMGVWFLANSVGNFIGGQVASFYEALPLTTLFGLVAAFSIAAGFGLTLLVKPMDRMSGGVK